MRWLSMLSLSLLLPGTASGASLSLTPASVQVGVGASFSLDLVLDGLGGASVGGFDVDVAFDATKLDFVGATFGGALGDVSLGEALGDVLEGAGSVNLAAVSLLSPAALAALQGDPVVLAAIEFHAIGPGSSAVTLPGAQVSDALASEIAIDAATEAEVQVPEPGALALLALGLLLIPRRFEERRRSHPA